MDSLTAAVRLPPLDNPHERAAIGHELAAVLYDQWQLRVRGARR